MNKKDELKSVIEKKQIYPVFQPIVSLRTGEIHGYESLSRITSEKSIKNTEELFLMAQHCRKTWELEKICRKKIFQQYALFSEKQKIGKLFVNVNPSVMMDESFKANFTRKQLEKYGICPERIVIEVTERSSTGSMDEFVQVVNHYKKEGYQIAIDDVGACYSGLNIICHTQPQYLKIDMLLIRDIDQDSMKRALVKGMVEIARNTSISLVAEGVETAAELQTLVKLGVDYAQGYFLGKPEKELLPTRKEARKLLECQRKSIYSEIAHWSANRYKIACITLADCRSYECYAEKYGDEKADDMMNLLFECVRTSLATDEYFHIIDEYNCVAIIERERFYHVCGRIRELFYSSVLTCYDSVDQRNGYIEKITKKGKRKKVALASAYIEEVL